MFLSAKSKLEQQYILMPQPGDAKLPAARNLLHIIDDIHIAQLLHQDIV